VEPQQPVVVVVGVVVLVVGVVVLVVEVAVVVVVAPVVQVVLVVVGLDFFHDRPVVADLGVVVVVVGHLEVEHLVLLSPIHGIDLGLCLVPTSSRFSLFAFNF